MNLVVQSLNKTFKLSKKQQKINQSSEKLKHAVNDVSFEAFPGEIFGLLGPNGAGKTTTMRMIATLIKPDSGTIQMGDFDALENTRRTRQNIAFLTNELKLEDYFTPQYLFEYFSKLYGVEESVMKMRRESLFKRFGIDRFAEVKVADLSSGMKQKTSIAISLVHDPDIIIFDEPTNGLDVLTAKTVLDYLFELKALGKTIIISTHILSVVEKIVDRVGIIIGGEMKILEPLETIKNSDSYVDLETLFFQLVEEGGDLNA
jgi:sodium transport system ATP-binding protein